MYKLGEAMASVGVTARLAFNDGYEVSLGPLDYLKLTEDELILWPADLAGYQHVWGVQGIERGEDGDVTVETFAKLKVLLELVWTPDDKRLLHDWLDMVDAGLVWRDYPEGGWLYHRILKSSPSLNLPEEGLTS